MKTIFLVIPRRISVRYILSSDVLDYLKKDPDSFLVILTSINDPSFIKEFSSQNVVVENIPMRDGREFFLERWCRNLRNYLGSIGYDLATLNAKAKMKGRLVWLSYRFLVVIVRPFLFLRSWLKWLDIKVFSYFLDKNYEVLFDRYNPDLVCIHSVQELTAVPVARVARRRKIPSLGIVLSWDNLANKGDIYSYSDKLVVWNNIMRNHAVLYHGYKKENVFVIGTPQFDFYSKYKEEIPSRDAFFESLGLDKNKKLIVYTTVPERIGGQTEIDSIESIYQAMNGCQLLVRIYTKDDPSRYERFKNLPGLILYDPGKVGQNLGYRGADKFFFLQLAAMIKYASVVINIASTTSIDAAILDTPIINIAIGKQRYWYETTHYRDLIATNGVSLVKSLEELTSAISNYLESPTSHKEGRAKIVELLCGELGKSSQKLAQCIIS